MTNVNIKNEKNSFVYELDASWCKEKEKQKRNKLRAL